MEEKNAKKCAKKKKKNLQQQLWCGEQLDLTKEDDIEVTLCTSSDVGHFHYTDFNAADIFMEKITDNTGPLSVTSKDTDTVFQLCIKLDCELFPEAVNPRLRPFNVE